MKKHWKVLTGVVLAVLAIVFAILLLVPVSHQPIGSYPSNKDYRIVMDFRAGYQPHIYREFNIIVSESTEFVCGGGGSHKGTSLYLDHSDTNFGEFYIPIHSRTEINAKFRLEFFSLTKSQLQDMKPDTTYRLYLFYEKNIFGMRINKHIFVDWESARMESLEIYSPVSPDEIYENATLSLLNSPKEFCIKNTPEFQFFPGDGLLIFLLGWNIDKQVSFKAVLNQYELRPMYDEGKLVAYVLLAQLGRVDDFVGINFGGSEKASFPAYISVFRNCISSEDFIEVQALLKSKIGKEVKVCGHIDGLFLEGMTSWPEELEDWQKIKSLGIDFFIHTIEGTSLEN